MSKYDTEHDPEFEELLNDLLYEVNLMAFEAKRDASQKKKRASNDARQAIECIEDSRALEREINYLE